MLSPGMRRSDSCEISSSDILRKFLRVLLTTVDFVGDSESDVRWL